MITEHLMLAAVFSTAPTPLPEPRVGSFEGVELLPEAGSKPKRTAARSCFLQDLTPGTLPISFKYRSRSSR